MFQFLKDFLIYGFASILSKVVAIFLMPIYTSILTREEYGAMAMLLSVSGVIDLISNLNIHSGIARDYYDVGDNRKILISTGFWSILSLALSVMAILFVSRKFWLCDVLNLESFESSFILLLLSIPTQSLMSYFSILTRFKKKPILYTIGNISSLIVQVLLSIYTVIVLRKGIPGIFFSLLISNLFAMVYFAYINREFLGLNFEKKYLKRALLFSIPTLPAILAGWLDSSLGQILIGKYISLTDLGVYSIALQLSSVFSLVSIALNNVWSPFLYENYQKTNFEHQLKSIFLLFVLLICVITSGVSLFSNEIILLLSNSSYLDAGKYLTLLCIPMGVYLLFPFASSGVSISRDTKYLGYSYIIGTVLNLSFLLILLPYCGILTVPIGLAVSRVITFYLLSYVTKKKGYFILPNRYLLILILLSVLCYVLLEMHISLLYRISIFMILNIILLRLFNGYFNVVDTYKMIIAKLKHRV